jgi:hypothetical protein
VIFLFDHDFLVNLDPGEMLNGSVRPANFDITWFRAFSESENESILTAAAITPATIELLNQGCRALSDYYLGAKSATIGPSTYQLDSKPVPSL